TRRLRQTQFQPPPRRDRIASDTAEFAVASIRQWLNRMGRKRYPDARELTITADCGGSNGARVRLWKIELQRFADETGLVLNVHHYPQGTSKWNRIEHRLFCHITQTWRGRPLTDRMSCMIQLPTAMDRNAVTAQPIATAIAKPEARPSHSRSLSESGS